MIKIDYFLIKRPIPGAKDTGCGDTGIIKEFDNKIFIAILDVAGHGTNANKLAVICEDFLEKIYQKSLIEIMNSLHEHIKGSQGIVAELCLLDKKTGILKYVGIGNVVARKFGASYVRITPRSGIIGYVTKSPQEEIMQLSDGDTLLLYTDGIRESFELEDYPELLKDDAKTVATNVIHMFGKDEDDACCIALKFRGEVKSRK